MVLGRKYFIFSRTGSQEFLALEACIGENYTQRFSLDFSKIAIKTNNDIINYFLKNDTSVLGVEYNYEDFKSELSTDFWQDNEFNNIK